MSKLVQVILLVALPLAWGLGVEWVFEHLRRRRASGQGRGDGEGRA